MGTKAGAIDLAELSSEDPKVKYGGAKSILNTAKIDPSCLYPHIEFFEKLMVSENKILRWTGIDVIGRLAKVDCDKKVDRLLNKLFQLLNMANLITACHAVSA